MKGISRRSRSRLWGQAMSNPIIMVPPGNVVRDNHLLQTARTEVLNRTRERWFKWMVAGKNKKSASGFFDAYPRFFTTSQARAHP
jgi:hypothetical protein